jgi:hypothetical protein
MLLAAFLIGCTTLTAKNVDLLKPQVTTIEDAKKILGKPKSYSYMGNGETFIQWMDISSIGAEHVAILFDHDSKMIRVTDKYGVGESATGVTAPNSLNKDSGNKERIGISTTNLPAEVQQRLERNKGALIVDLIRGPAFDANMLVGDVVIAINGTQVIDIASMAISITDACRKGGPVVATILRGKEGKQLDISMPNCI